MTPTKPTELMEEFYPSRLQALMPFKVRKVLLISSLYDAFMMEEDGRLADLLARTYKQQDLGYVPSIYRASGGQAALEMLREDAYDLAVTLQRLGDMDPFTFGREAKALRPGLPVVVLAYNTPELPRILERADRETVDRVFVWQGDGKILAGIIQYAEDLRNAAPDTAAAGIQNLLVVEDSVHFYSAYLPVLFEELWDQTDRILREDLTHTLRSLRQRARPKVHLAVNWEEAVEVLDRFRGKVLGVVTDVRYPRGGVEDPGAGIDLVRLIRARDPWMPVLIQSSEPDRRAVAEELGVGLLDKSSRTLVADFRRYLQDRFGFGDLVFHADGGAEVARAANLPGLLRILESVPGEAVLRSVRTGELRRWLLARTEFEMAERVAGLDAASAETPKQVRGLVKEGLEEVRRAFLRGGIAPFSRELLGTSCRFMKLGGGSIGGKGRGLAFIDRVLANVLEKDRFPGVDLAIPRTLVLGTDVFDRFIEENNLRGLATGDASDRQIASAFIRADFPSTLVGDLRYFANSTHLPLAARSSSLLEDALYQPFAGIYCTKMIPNHHMDADKRFKDLANAIKLVWASTFFRKAKAYIESTNHRIEEEKMAVVIQEVVGRRHGHHYYPDFSGVACSWNYYPAGHAKPEDGQANVALGLGKMVVDGGVALRFAPPYPHILPQFGTIDEMFENGQKEFYAVNLKPAATSAYDDEDQFLVKLPVKQAEQDGVLTHLASTWMPDDQRFYDGIAGPGPKVVTFAPVLKMNVFPLSDILSFLLKTAEDAMGCPIETEFAVVMDPDKGLPAQYGFLQVRPMVVSDELVTVDLGEADPERTLCWSHQVLGNGVYKGIRDLVYVKPSVFSAAKTPDIARQVDRFNAAFKAEDRPYVLVGPGRWGSSDPWLGVPVHWGQISAVKVIVETAIPTMNVDPSQGSHFFQNMTSLRVGYFTIPLNRHEADFHWDRLDALPAAGESEHLRHVRFEEPLEIRIDGRSGDGVIVLPSV
ncbi:MAG: hypothetical protein KA419_20270 [Acidobacteria bacterium]|nr:hypothetical protein [Acidobacteriota bacterium]